MGAIWDVSLSSCYMTLFGSLNESRAGELSLRLTNAHLAGVVLVVQSPGFSLSYRRTVASASKTVGPWRSTRGFASTRALRPGSVLSCEPQDAQLQPLQREVVHVSAE